MLRKQKHRRALKIGHWLIKRRFTGGYDLVGRTLWELGRQVEATECLEKGVKEFPTMYLLWSYLGEYRSLMGQYDLAIEAFEHSRHSSQPDVALYNIGLVHARSGRHEDAIRYLSPIELSRDNRITVWAHNTLAHVYTELGEFELARSTWQTVCEFSYKVVAGTEGEEDLALSFGRWAIVEHKLGNLHEAQRILKLGQKFNPFQVDVLEAERLLNAVPLSGGFLFEVV
ncbi:MAG TPA: tetratricopeptide repeat protein, partial [Fimbriimonas sp.]|nr:tetratricopeptide repeat protein [Fimbriimonas sp.]